MNKSKLFFLSFIAFASAQADTPYTSYINTDGKITIMVNIPEKSSFTGDNILIGAGFATAITGSTVTAIGNWFHPEKPSSMSDIASLGILIAGSGFIWKFAKAMDSNNPEHLIKNGFSEFKKGDIEALYAKAQLQEELIKKAQQSKQN